MAVLYGMRYGPRYGVPLGLLALGVGATFLSCNRHYVSQMVAGAGFGAMYAIAANKLINENLARDFNLGMQIDHTGSPLLSISWRF
jgi:membrane-associated phospholipid phosphatase